MTLTDHHRFVAATCSMVDWHAWGMHGNAVAFYQLNLTETGWVEISRTTLATWIGCHKRTAEKYLKDLVATGVFELFPGAGNRGHHYRLRHPREWRGVPWRIRGPKADDDRTPELVIRRLDDLLSPPVRHESPFVTGPQPVTRPFSDRLPGGHYRSLLPPSRRSDGGSSRPPAGRSQIGGGPPSRESPEGAIGRGVTTGGYVEEEEGTRLTPGPELVTLTGGAAKVAAAVVEYGQGPINKPAFREQLQGAFGDVDPSDEWLTRVVAALWQAGRGGGGDQGVPRLVAFALQLAENRDLLPAPRTAVAADPEAAERVAYLEQRRDEWLAMAREAAAEGCAEEAGIFAERALECEADIDQLKRRIAV